MSVRGTALEELLLHAAAVLLKAFVIAATVAWGMKEIEAFEDIVSKRVSARCIAQRCSGP